MYETSFALRLSMGLITLLVWLLAIGSVVFWWLRLGDALAPLSTSAVGSTARSSLSVDTRVIARALGAPEGEFEYVTVALEDPGLSRRLALRGVLTHDAGGVALIAVDDQPAQPVRVGAPITGLDGDWVLRAVMPHAAVLAADMREFRLEMPPMGERSRRGDAVASTPRRPPGVVPRRTRTGSGQSVGMPTPTKPQSR